MSLQTRTYHEHGTPISKVCSQFLAFEKRCTNILARDLGISAAAKRDTHIVTNLLFTKLIFIVTNSIVCLVLFIRSKMNWDVLFL